MALHISQEKSGIVGMLYFSVIVELVFCVLLSAL